MELFLENALQPRMGKPILRKGMARPSRNQNDGLRLEAPQRMKSANGFYDGIVTQVFRFLAEGIGQACRPLIGNGLHCQRGIRTIEADEHTHIVRLSCNRCRVDLGTDE